MAGRVEEIINNKFYFVLDEVGASDCDSDLSTENDLKEGERRRLKINSTGQINQDGTNSEKNDSVVNEIKNENFHFPCPKSFDLNEPLKDDGSANKAEKEQNEGGTKMSSSPLEVPDLSPEETSVVDMDIESEVESEKASAEEVEPLVRITFQDHDIKKFLKPALMKFFLQKIEDCTLVTSSKDGLELEVYDKKTIKLKNDVLSFDLDTTPTHGNYSDVPNYGKTHDFILSDKNSEEKESENFAPFNMACFNCLKSHNLKDCNEIKDFKTINKNRLRFKSMKMTKTSRYHMDEAQKFNAIVPGAISKKLRNALNLHSNQLPGFIYRMRLLGYPPAWLEEAKVSHSGVTMYNSTGIPVLEDDEEEGEIVPEGSKDKFDISKIIEFPGFNVPLPNNVKDEAKLYGYPDISDEQSKETLINLLKPKTVQAYEKKSLTLTKSDNQPQDNLKRRSSPTIEEMEEKKRQLLMELDDVESSSVSKLNFEDSSSGASGTEKQLPETPPIKEPGSVRNSEFGTPILKSVSPFSKLPSREQFSVNMSEILNFENLPNSTGKYETMRHVITKIRVSTSKAQSK